MNTIEAFSIFKVTKKRGENPEVLKLTASEEQIKNMIMNKLIEDILRKKLSRDTNNYEIEKQGNPVNDIMESMLNCDENTFLGLANDLCTNYKLVERSRTAILVVVRFVSKFKHIGLFKLPPFDVAVIEGTSLRYPEEAFRKYQKGIVYPDPAKVKDIKITQKGTQSEYFLKLFKAKLPETPTQLLYKIWNQNKDITYSELKKVMEKQPELKEAMVTITVGPYSFKEKLGSIEEHLGKLGDVPIALLDGSSAIMKIGSKAKISIQPHELEEATEILKRKG